MEGRFSCFKQWWDIENIQIRPLCQQSTSYSIVHYKRALMELRKLRKLSSSYWVKTRLVYEPNWQNSLGTFMQKGALVKAQFRMLNGCF